VREVILKMSVSVDGFVSGPDGEIDWLLTDDDAAVQWTVESIAQAGVHIMGSRTFRDMAAFWPTDTGPFAAPMNEIPKVYFSRSGVSETTQALVDAGARRGDVAEPTAAATASWETARVATGDLREEIARLAGEPGGEIVAHGGAAFAASLVGAGLVDEYRLLTHPVVLGQGRPLFTGAADRIDLELVDVTRFAGGAVAHVYRRQGA
jgi:dihydrofolate reductase